MHNLHHTTLESLKHRFVILKLLRHLFFQNWLEHLMSFYRSASSCSLISFETRCLLALSWGNSTSLTTSSSFKRETSLIFERSPIAKLSFLSRYERLKPVDVGRLGSWLAIWKSGKISLLRSTKGREDDLILVVAFRLRSLF